MNLTAEMIDAEPAGRRLDAWVAYHLFGWRWRKHLGWDDPPGVHTLLCDPPFFPNHDWLSDPLRGFETGWKRKIDGWENWFDLDGYVPHFSTTIAAAWTVTDKLPPRWLLAFDGKYHVRKTLCVTHHSESGEATYAAMPIASGETAPLAICCAALKSVLTLATV